MKTDYRVVGVTSSFLRAASLELLNPETRGNQGNTASFAVTFFQHHNLFPINRRFAAKLCCDEGLRSGFKSFHFNLLSTRVTQRDCAGHKRKPRTLRRFDQTQPEDKGPTPTGKIRGSFHYIKHLHNQELKGAIFFCAIKIVKTNTPHDSPAAAAPVHLTRHVPANESGTKLCLCRPEGMLTHLTLHEPEAAMTAQPTLIMGDHSANICTCFCRHPPAISRFIPTYIFIFSSVVPFKTHLTNPNESYTAHLAADIEVCTAEEESGMLFAFESRFA